MKKLIQVGMVLGIIFYVICIASAGKVDVGTSGKVGIGEYSIEYQVVKAGGKTYTPECFECDLPIAITYNAPAGKDLKLINLAKGYFKVKEGKSIFGRAKQDKIKFKQLEILVNKSYTVDVPVYGWIQDGGNCSSIQISGNTLKCIINSTFYYTVAKNGTSATARRVWDGYNSTHWWGSKWIIKSWKTETRYKWVWRPIKPTDRVSPGETVVINFHASRVPDAGRFKADFIPQVSINGINLDFSNLAWWNASWEKVMLFNVTTPPTTADAVYKLVIDGANWTLYNATGAVEATATSAVFWSLVQADGDDLRIANESNEIYWWRESWDYTNQKTTVWIRLPAGSEMIKVVYGNDNATATAYEDPTKVFDWYDVDWGDLTQYTYVYVNANYTWSQVLSGIDGNTLEASTTEIGKTYFNTQATLNDLIIEVDVRRTGTSTNEQPGVVMYANSSYFIEFRLSKYSTTDVMYIIEYINNTEYSTSITTTTNFNSIYHLIVKKKNSKVLFEVYNVSNNNAFVGSLSKSTNFTFDVIAGLMAASGAGTMYFDNLIVYTIVDSANFLDGREQPVAKPPTDPTNITFNRTAYYVGNIINATASGSTDPEGVGVTYYYNFTVNGVEKQTWSTDNTYKITVDDAHAQIMVCAKAYNGYRFSNATCAYIPPDGYVQNTPPVVTSYDTDKDSYMVGENITATMTATDADNDTLTYEYKFEDVTTATILQDWSTNNIYTVTAAEDGHTIRVWFRAYDGYNYSSEVYKDVVVAKATPPQIINVTPAPPITIYEGTITFSATVNQTADCEWVLNGARQEWDSATTSPSFTYTFSAGNYTLTLIAHNHTLPSLTDSYTWQISVSVQPTPTPETYRILKTSSLSALLLASLAAFMLILFGLVAYLAGKTGSGAALLIVSVIIFVMVMFGLWAALHMFKLAGWT